MSEDQNSHLLKLAKGTGISLVGSVAGRLLLFLSHVVVARFLGAEVFGVFVLAAVGVKVAELIARLGLDTATMRFVSLYRNESPEKLKGTLISSIAIGFLNGVIVGILLYFAAGVLSERIFRQRELSRIIRLLSFCIPFMASMRIVAASTRGFQTTRFSVYVMDIIQPLVNFALIIVLLLLRAGIKGVLYAFVMSHIAGLVAGLYFLLKQRFLDLTKTIQPQYNIRELISCSAPLLVNGFLVFLMAWTDTIMLGIMRTSADVGVYRAAVQIPLLMAVILQASNSIYAPVGAELFFRGQMGRLGSILKTTTRWVFTLSLPVAIVFVFSAKQLMLIFGPEFVNPGAAVLVITAAGQLVNAATGGIGYTLIMTGRQNIQVFNSMAMVACNVVLNCLLIPGLGGTGAALATAFSLAVINVLKLVEVYAIYKIHPYDFSYLKVLAGGLIAAVIVLLLKRVVEIDSRPVLVLAHFFVVGTVFAVFLVLSGLAEDDIHVLNGLVSELQLRHKVK
ncbi:MAG: flippase [Planctomycetota bacterium]|jgi:O-antigen/teichoic acid export membrane protein